MRSGPAGACKVHGSGISGVWGHLLLSDNTHLAVGLRARVECFGSNFGWYRVFWLTFALLATANSGFVFPYSFGRRVFADPVGGELQEDRLFTSSLAMPPLQPFLTVHGFLSALSIRVRLTCRYLELLLDCGRHEFLIERADVQRDWASNVEALRWLAGRFIV